MQNPEPSHHAAEAFARYSSTGCEEAFRSLVGAHFGLVHGTAIRLLNGDAHAAQDVAQEVFTLLARKAHQLPRGTAPASWLYRQTHRRAVNAIRRASRQRRREAIAAPELEPSSGDPMDPDWQALAPELDRALLALSAADRDAIVLRYLDDRSHREVGAALGIGPEAARKRTERALDRLREWLARHGVVFHSVAPLAALLSANVIHPAPATAVVATMANGALQSGSPSLLATVLTDTPAMLAGVMTGLVAVTVGVSLSAGTPQLDAETMTKRPDSPSARHARGGTPLWAKAFSASPSVHEILERLRELADAPDHSLTRLQREATLAAIAPAQLHELFTLAAAELEGAERDSILGPIFLKWTGLDPRAALETAVGLKCLPWTWKGAYREWLNQDLYSAADWLVANAEIMRRRGASGYDAHLATGEALLELAGVEAAINFALRFSDDRRRDVFAQLLPINGRRGEWFLTDDGRHTEALRVLRSLGDRDLGRSLEEKFWTVWAESDPSKAEAALSEVENSAMRLHARIQIAGARKSGDVDIEAIATPRLQAALDEAAAMGIDRSEVLEQTFTRLWQGSHPRPDSPITKMFLNARTGPEFDVTIARGAAGYLILASAGYSGGVETAFEWAEVIHDENFRALVYDGLLLRLQARGGEVAEQAFTSGEVPAKLQERFRELNSEYTITP